MQGDLPQVVSDASGQACAQFSPVVPLLLGAQSHARVRNMGNDGILTGSSLENGITLQPPLGRYQCFKETHFEADWGLSEQISCSFS